MQHFVTVYGILFTSTSWSVAVWQYVNKHYQFVAHVLHIEFCKIVFFDKFVFGGDQTQKWTQIDSDISEFFEFSDENHQR